MFRPWQHFSIFLLYPGQGREVFWEKEAQTWESKEKPEKPGCGTVISRVVADKKAKIHKLYAQQQIWEFTIGCGDNNLRVFCTKILASDLQTQTSPSTPIATSPRFTPCPRAPWHQWEKAQKPVSAQIRHPPLASSEKMMVFPSFPPLFF